MKTIWDESCIFSPSLICFDLCNLEEQVRLLEQAGIKLLHVDILDGHFSPSMPLGLETVRQLRSKTNLDFDVHLMAACNDYFVDELLDIGVQQLVFHAETEKHMDHMLNKIKGRGVRAGVALKPATSLSTIEYVIENCDTVLLMLINPGYAGNVKETQVPYAERKIKDLRNMVNERGSSALIEIDGRISIDNISKYAGEYVDVFVIGSTCISCGGIPESTGRLNRIRSDLLKARKGADV
ncbi:MAG TPA: ribulose-phosphate 3-epimerase [Anaerovoracaceae bacterium]|nr:ribulose-phosphate 3-epimerase [Anaerovoracaceae bacterium]